MEANSRACRAMVVAAAAIAASLVFFMAFASFVFGGIPQNFGWQEMLSILVMFLIFFICALMPAVIFGYPTYEALKERNLVHWWTAGLSGIVIGSGTTFVIGSVIGATNFFSCLLFGGLGMLGGLAAWLVVRKENTPRFPLQIDTNQN